MLKRILIITITVLAFASGVLSKDVIEWWQFWTDPGIKPTIDSLVKEFETLHPDISVNVTDLTWADGQEKIVIAFSAGRAPDLLEVGSDWIAQFAANGYLADISTHIAKDSSNFQGWGMSTYNSKVYGKPWILGTRILFGNRDLLKKAGFDSTFIPINWQQLGDVAYTVRRLGKDIYGWGSNIAEKHRLYKKFLPFFWSNGAQIFTDDNKYCIISQNKAIEALAFYKLLSDSCGYVADQRGIEDAFLDGKVGIIISGDWLLKRIELEKRNINLASWLIPGRKYTGKSFLGGEMLVVNEKSSKKEAALTFIDFLTSPENQVRFCKANRSANPSSVIAQKDPYFTSNPHLMTFIRQIKSSVYPPVDPGWPLIEDAIEKAVEDALFGRKLPATALWNAQVSIAKIRANEKP